MLEKPRGKSLKIHLSAALAIRLLLVLYSTWHDNHLELKYTDIDYSVFSDAAEFVRQNQSPYQRPTYRYTPILAWLLQPNSYIPQFGKVVFCICDVLCGALIYALVRKVQDHESSLKISYLWLYNPMPIAIATRGSAESIMVALVLSVFYFIDRKRIILSAAIYGLAVHMKIYPITYALPIYLSLGTVDKDSLAKFIASVLPGKERLKFGLVAGITFIGLTALCYRCYGLEFVDETYLYHVTRKDTRHNFSPYFYLLYLTADVRAGFASTLAVVLFVPQAFLLVLLSIALHRDLPLCCFLQTFIFVTYNKVCTSQYFLWYLCLVPVIAPRVYMSWRQAATLLAAWFLGQGLWLFPAYLLEFQGQSTFLLIWAAGLVFFSVNIYIAGEVIAAAHHVTSEKRKIEDEVTAKMDIHRIVQAMDVLTKPVTTAHNNADIEALLAKNIEHIESDDLYKDICDNCTEERSNEDNARGKFVHYCLELLKRLCQFMEECLEVEKLDPKFIAPRKPNSAPPLSGAALSIGHQQTIASLLQFLTLIGICPNLSNGVGMPLQYRTNFEHLLDRTEKDGLCQRKNRLLKIVNILLRCSKLHDLDTLVLSLHLSDLLAAMCQICYETEEQGKTMKCACEGEDIEICDSKECQGKIDVEKRLLELMVRVKPEFVIKEVMMLQGGSGKMRPTIRGLEKPLLTKSPLWLRRVCGRLLSGQLLKQDGVRHVTAAMFDATGDEDGEWRKCEVLAGIISTCPRHVATDDYVKNICGQLLSLLRHGDVTWETRVTCAAVRALYVKHPLLVHAHLLEEVTAPLRRMCGEEDVMMRTSCTEDVLVVGEEDLARCIESVYQLFVVRPDGEFMRLLLPSCHPLFSLYCRARMGVSHVRNQLKETLTTMLKESEPDQSLSLLLAFTFREKANIGDMVVKPMRNGLSFVSGSDGGYRVERNCDDSELNRVGAVVDLVVALKTGGAAGRFFLHLLQELTKIIQSPDDVITEDTELLTLEDRHARCTERHLVVVQVLGELSGKLDSSCVEEPRLVIAFAKATLERGLLIVRTSDDDLTSVFESETLSMAMSLLTAVMGGKTKISAEDRLAMQELLPLLEDISTNHPDPSIAEMATDIRIAIATRGAVLAASKRKAESETKKTKPKPLIEVIDDTESEEVLNDSEFQKALKELCDPLVPIRGHALISLRKLIQNGDKETLEKRSFLKNIFMENLDHQDTYIYLAAIEGLAQLGDRYPDEVLPLLCDHFVQENSKSRTFPKSSPTGLWRYSEKETSQESQKTKKVRSPELRLKSGEVLLKISRGLGDMLPHYGTRLVNAYLSTTRDEDASVRASGLSNLGQVCKMLKWSLGKDVHEITSCCVSLLRSDGEVEVRRAAALMIQQMLEGTDRNTIQVLDSTLRDLYRQLKVTTQTETDEALLTHAHMALTSLDDVMKSVLFPPQELVKELRIKDPF